ncbi:hypothetical protein [Flavobacterium sp. LM5]|uniref:hypothetical protein n=1 Tax=Flavobacterium sp. LM5 TaxID=1938610 RepID=UPI0016703700|nr:hypothetical protein [Flavobacterium sp. LM5]
MLNKRNHRFFAYAGTSSIEVSIGEKTMITLIEHFKSVKRIQLATEKEISEVIACQKPKKFPTFTRNSTLLNSCL